MQNKKNEFLRINFLTKLLKTFLFIFIISLFSFGLNIKQAQAAITFVAKGTFASGTGALTVAVPVGYADGDVFLLFVESANQAITTPSGWTQLTNSPKYTGTAATAGGVRLGVFYKVVSGTQASVSVVDTGNHTTAIIMDFRGVDTTTPIEITAGAVSAATTAMSFPTVTTTSANAMIVLAAAMDTDANSTATVTGWTNANLTSITERQDKTISSGVGGGLAIATGFKATAGATGASTATGSTSVTHAYLTIGLKPYIPVPPTVTTTNPVATSITDTTAVLNGNITAIGGSAPTTRGFDYSTVSDLSSGVTTTVESGGSSENFEGGLLPFPPTGWTTGGSVNWVRDTSTTHNASAGSATSSASVPDNGTSWLSYTKTFSNAGSVNFYWKVSSESTYDFLVFCLDINGTCSRTVYTGTNAISGTVDWVQVTVPVSAGTHDFRWLYGKDTNTIGGSDMGWIDDIEFIEGFGTGAYASTAIAYLNCGTTYYARAYATSAQGTGQGSIQSFTTTACVAPSVTSPTATNITPNSATLGANVTAQGDSAITARGTCWDTTPSPTANCLAEGGTTTGVFTHSRTDLPIGTFIYYRGYATNANGHTAYSTDGTFSTTGSVTGSLGKTTDSWGGAIPVYSTLSVITNTDYPYARAKVVTAASETYYFNMTWSSGNNRFEGTIYPGSYYCEGCVDPTTGTFSVTVQLDNNTDFSSVDANASVVTFSTYTSRRRSSMDAANPSNYADMNSVWVTDHWAHTIKDFAWYQGSGATVSNVALPFLLGPTSATISNIAVWFDGVSVTGGSAASTTNAWWWDATTHSVYVQKASMLTSPAGATNLTNVKITFDSDTDLGLIRYDHTNTYDMGPRIGYNGLVIYNQYYTAFMYGSGAVGSDGAGMQAESRAHDNGADDDTSDCMERIAVHVNGTPLADSSGAYQYDIKWDPNSYKTYIKSQDNNNIVLEINEDDTPSTGYIQYLNNGLKVKRTQTYSAGSRVIDNLYAFTNTSAGTESLPIVWERESWLSSKAGSERSLLDQSRFYGDVADTTIEVRNPMNNYAHKWEVQYDSAQFVAMGVIFDETNVTADTYGVFAGEPILATGIAEWPLNITVPNANPGSYPSNVTHQAGYEHTFPSVAPGATVTWHFGQFHYDTTSLQNVLDAIDADYTAFNGGGTPSLTQSSYRWRNDNADETSASYAVEENAPLLSGVYVGSPRRLRVAVSNTGGNTATNRTYKLEYSSGACVAWSPVPAAGDNSGPWVMATSGYVSDSAISSHSTGVSTPNGKSFVAGKVMTSTNQTAAITTTNAQYTELEYSIAPTSNVSTAATYCFRVTNAGNATGFTYASIPTIKAQNVVYITRTGGGSVESSGTPTGTVGGGNAGGGTVLYQCNDTIDNDTDTLIDILDPECHVGGNINNAYVPTNDSEVIPQAAPSGGGGSGGGGGDSGYLYQKNNLAYAGGAQNGVWNFFKSFLHFIFW